ncbi:MAG: DUF948 domain-containing protein [Lactobacillaceae bacterium]|jgi:uncharacterized protein YoxC|nr:DUF948 domain-containing protein [Lactobacillaceae bacterium]
MNMNLTEIAAIVAALAFVVLVIYLVVVLVNVDKTLKIVNKHLDPITADVESIIASAEKMSADIASKVEKLDPVFVAAGDLGESVSHFAKKKNREDEEPSSIKKTVVDLANTAIKSGVAVQVASGVVNKVSKKRAAKKADLGE